LFVKLSSLVHGHTIAITRALIVSTWNTRFLWSNWANI